MLVIFGNGAGAVGFQQHQQGVYPGLQFRTFVGLMNPHPGFQNLKNPRFVVNVVIFVNGVPLTGEGLVGHQPVVPGIVNQGIAGNAGGALVSPAEAAVNDQKLAAALDGAFALLGFYGNVAVDPG